jgi:hypothetical protein
VDLNRAFTHVYVLYDYFVRLALLALQVCTKVHIGVYVILVNISFAHTSGLDGNILAVVQS